MREERAKQEARVPHKENTIKLEDQWRGFFHFSITARRGPGLREGSWLCLSHKTKSACQQLEAEKEENNTWVQGYRV